MENELGKYLTSRMETVWGNTVNDYNKDDNIYGIKVYVFLEGTQIWKNLPVLFDVK